MCEAKDYKLLKTNGKTLKWHGAEHELPDWHETYPMGETILDVGASSGETALFFLSHGARRVICIEANPEAVKNLRINKKRLLKKFPYAKIDIIQAEISGIKIDIDGGEKNFVMETNYAFQRHHNKAFPYTKLIWLLGGGDATYTLKERKPIFKRFLDWYNNSWVRFI